LLVVLDFKRTKTLGHLYLDAGRLLYQNGVM
jgi:hypothetical protein